MNDRAVLARPAAIVTSATVDVHVLRIGAKQMTLAVFRQLLRDDLMTGPMWGTVNYHHRLFPWPCQGKPDSRHAHVVWQRGGELRHATALLLPGWDVHHDIAVERVMKAMRDKYWTRLYREDDLKASLRTGRTAWLDTLAANGPWLAPETTPSEWIDRIADNPYEPEDLGSWAHERHEIALFTNDVHALPQLFIAV